MTEAAKETRYGLWCGVGAYGLWGVFPLYFKPLRHVPALEIIAHRILWAMPFLALVLWLRGGFGRVRAALRHGPTVRLLLVSSALIGANWLTYVHAVTNGLILEASFGYFITPLLNVALGALLLGERLRPLQMAAVGFAVAGVGCMGAMLGALPWLALSMAFSFAFYGLCRKRVPLDAVSGLYAETLLLWPVGVGYVLWLGRAGEGHFLSTAATGNLLAWSGPVTAVPLLLFAGAARRLPFSTIGFLQFIGPSIQAWLGWLDGETFTPARRAGFGLIAAAAAVFVADMLAARRAAQPRSGESAGGNSTPR